MSPLVYACFICGYPIYDPVEVINSSWLKEFRASMGSSWFGPRANFVVYSTSEGTFVSGVGCYNDPSSGIWTVPSGSTARWDDETYVFQPSDVIPVMKQAPRDGRHGFVLHDACWRLLQKALPPENTHLKRLYQICKSIPFSLHGVGLSWEHNYGGLLTLDKQSRFPWEDCVMEVSDDSEILTEARKNPHDVPEVFDLLTSFSRKLSVSQLKGSLEFIPQTNRLTSLPWEICEAIAINLSTKDAIAFCMSSKRFLPLLTSQTFWASRFSSTQDRGFIFEAQTSTMAMDWISLYQATTPSRSPPNLRNRRRIWNAIQNLGSLLRLHHDDTIISSRKESNVSEQTWHEVAGDIHSDANSGHRRPFENGCKRFKSQCVAVPRVFSRLAFSVVGDGEVEYIVGMRFVSESDADICLGYVSNINEVSLEVKTLRGFELIMGSRGIHALRVLSDDEQISGWVGSPGDSPVTDRLAIFGQACALEVGLDGFKIVSLAIAELRSTPDPRLKMPSSSLRASALWYPSIPAKELCLNDKSFTGLSLSTTSEYLPLFWTRFGGIKGENLRHMTELRVTLQGHLSCIEFLYDVQDVSIEMHKLGRCKHNEFSHIIRFPIDGPGGEFIQNVDVSILCLARGSGLHRREFVHSFKVTTNRGRTAHFQPEDTSDWNPPGLPILGPVPEISELHPLSIAPGTILTGFYASREAEFGITSLGAISEVL